MDHIFSQQPRSGAVFADFESFGGSDADVYQAGSSSGGQSLAHFTGTGDASDTSSDSSYGGSSGDYDGGESYGNDSYGGSSDDSYGGDSDTGENTNWGGDDSDNTSDDYGGPVGNEGRQVAAPTQVQRDRQAGHPPVSPQSLDNQQTQQRMEARKRAVMERIWREQQDEATETLSNGLTRLFLVSITFGVSEWAPTEDVENATADYRRRLSESFVKPVIGGSAAQTTQKLRVGWLIWEGELAEAAQSELAFLEGFVSNSVISQAGELTDPITAPERSRRILQGLKNAIGEVTFELGRERTEANRIDKKQAEPWYELPTDKLDQIARISDPFAAQSGAEFAPLADFVIITIDTEGVLRLPAFRGIKPATRAANSVSKFDDYVFLSGGEITEGAFADIAAAMQGRGTTIAPRGLVAGDPNTVITRFPGRGPNHITTLGRLNDAASSGGPTQPVFTRLSRDPIPDRPLSVSVGSSELANAVPNSSAVGVYSGQVPKRLIEEMRMAGLIEESTTLMNGVVGTEIKFLYPATEWIVPFLKRTN